MREIDLLPHAMPWLAPCMMIRSAHDPCCMVLLLASSKSSTIDRPSLKIQSSRGSPTTRACHLQYVGNRRISRVLHKYFSVSNYKLFYFIKKVKTS